MSKQKLFPLSKSSSLVAIIILNLIGIPVYANSGIQPADNKTKITTLRGVPIIDIATPNRNGLSHNKYNSYNISNVGAVLNNATIATQSTILNQVLSANQNLTKNKISARIILNEVISTQPSNLFGKQEVLGKRADLILANPNGITCSGCGFINTNKASLVVGTPHISGGYLQGFNTRNTNKLVIRERGITTDNILNLFTPSIHSSGLIKAKNINIITGHNDITTSGYVIRSQKHFARTDVDSYLLGGMQAGKIKIINTNEGSGINLRGENKSQEYLTIDTEGNLHFQATKLNSNKLNINAKSLSTEGEIKSLSSHTKDKDNYSHFNGAKFAETKDNSSQIVQTELKGKNITIRTTGNSNLNATKIIGDTLDFSANNIELNNRTLSNSHERTNNRWHLSWFNNQTTKNSQERVISTEINIKHKANLQATNGNIDIVASKIHSDDNLTLSARKYINIKGAIEKSSSSDVGAMKNETASLKTGHWNNTTYEDKVIQSTLSANKNIGLDAKSGINLTGVSITANNDIILNTPANINITVSKGRYLEQQQENFTYWGGIGGGYNKNNHKNHQTITSSNIQANHDLLLLGEKNINISGSRVKGRNQALVKTSTGQVIIDNATRFDYTNIRQRQGTAFNITTASTHNHSYTQATTASEVKSDVNLKVVGFNGINISGSILNSAGELGLYSLGDIVITSAEEKLEEKKNTTNLGINSSVEVKDPEGTATVEARSALVHTSTHEESKSTNQVSSQVSGKNITIDTAKNVAVVSSNLNSENNTKIVANNIEVTANANTTVVKRDTVTLSAGVKAYTGLDKTGIGITAGTGLKQHHSQDSNDRTSSITAGKDLTIAAQNEVKNVGSEYQVGGKTDVIAKKISNLASHNTHSEINKENNLELSLDANIQYGHIVKPIADTIRKTQASDKNPTTLINSTNSILKTLNKQLKPNAGPELGVSVTNAVSTANSSEAKVTKITSDSVNQNAGKIEDQATNYYASNNITLNTNDYQNTAVTNSKSEKSEITTGNGSLRVFTSTGKDINAELKGEGKNEKSDQSSNTAITGKIGSQQGNVIIHSKEGIKLEGIDVKAFDGKVELHTENGNIEIKSATSSTTHNTTSYNANAGLKAGILPDSKSFGGSLGGGYQETHNSATTSTTSTIQANQTSIKAKENVELIGTKIVNYANTGHIQITAGKDIIFKQATDTNNSSSANYKGSVAINQSKGKESNNALASIDGTYETKKASSVIGKAGEISVSDDVNLNAKGNILLEGTKIGNDQQSVKNVDIHSGGNTTLSATTNTSEEHNVHTSAEIKGGGSNTDNNEKTGISFDIFPSAKVEYIDKKSNQQIGGTIQANGKVNIISEGKQGISATGTKITGSETNLTATRGKVTLTSAESSEKHTEVKVNLNTSLGRTHDIAKPQENNTNATVTHTERSLFDLDAKVSIGDSIKHSNTTIDSSNTATINANSDITLAGATVKANEITVNTKGDIKIESKQDIEHLVEVNVNAHRQANDDPNSNLLAETNKLLNSTKPDKPANKVQANQTANNHFVGPRTATRKSSPRLERFFRQRHHSIPSTENNNVSLTSVKTNSYSLSSHSERSQPSITNAEVSHSQHNFSGPRTAKRISSPRLEKLFKQRRHSIASNGNSNVALTGVTTNNYSIHNNSTPSYNISAKDLFPSKNLQPSINQSWSNGITTALGVQASLEARVKVVDRKEVSTQAGLIAKNKINLQANQADLTAAKIEANTLNLKTKNTRLHSVDQHNSNVDIGVKGASYLAGMLTQAIDGIKDGNISPVIFSVTNTNETLQSSINRPVQLERNKK